MTKIELEIYDDIVIALNKIRAVNDSGVELHIPQGSPILDNIISLKLLKREAENMQKIPHFVTSDPAGLELLSQLQEEQTDTLIEHDAQSISHLAANIHEPARNKPQIKMPTMKMPQIGAKLPLVIGAILVLLAIVGGGGYYLYTMPKANVSIVVSSENLSKSIQIKVKEGSSTSAQQKTLRGYIFKSTLNESKEIETTGEKTVGKSAKGKIKLFNKTTEETEFKKGQVVTYENDDKDYSFTLNDEVTIPARTDNIDGTITSGEKEVEVTASDIGEAYNIKSGKTLEVKGKKSADFTAVSSSDFAGGKSEKVKVVAQADLTKLSQDVSAALKEKAMQDLKFKMGMSQKIIDGTLQTKVTQESFNHKVNEEAEKVSLTQDVEASVLVYSTSDMDEMLNELLKEFVPNGYVLSTKDKTISIEVLGNSASTVLKDTEADVQLTIRTYIIADITEDKVKELVKGIKLDDARTKLGEINNINRATIDLDPNISLLPFVPNDVNRINVEITRE